MVDQLLGGLFGGQADEDAPRRQARGRDFVNRYETGLPHEGYSDEEAIHNYRQAASSLSPQEFEDAAAEAFTRMPPEDRKRLRREMKQRSKGRINVDENNDDPRELARATSRYQQEDTSGGGLAGLFGMGGNNNQPQVQGHQQQEGGSLLDNPLAKVALGGIAAMAVKKMSER
ncbi:MAG: hypothetical protein H0V24_06575 [Chloroflexia bacterium]|nr:hypothetical protein [Chloroflexia bacterium]MDQ3410545.1 hypothetical protein [Chloroflexota bacterium]